MTEVAFHFNAADKWDYCCRLLRKAVARGARVAVVAEPGVLEQLDRQLWEFSATDFVPHCFANCPQASVLQASPVVLSPTSGAADHNEVLLNLGTSVPPGFELYDRLIEVVGLEDGDRDRSRVRWKHYKDRGYAITRHDLAAQGAT